MLFVSGHEEFGGRVGPRKEPRSVRKQPVVRVGRIDSQWPRFGIPDHALELPSDSGDSVRERSLIRPTAELVRHVAELPNTARLAAPSVPIVKAPEGNL